MKKTLYITLGIVALALITGSVFVHFSPNNSNIFSQNKATEDLTPFQNYQTAKIIEILSEEITENKNYNRVSQELRLKLTQEPNKGTEIVVLHDQSAGSLKSLKKYTVNEKTVVGQLEEYGTASYIIVDSFRLNALLVIVLIFFGLTIYFGKRK